MTIEQILADELKLKEEQVVRTVELIDEGNTIPFIARYRKEVTGSLDDTVLRDLYDRLNYLRGIEKRREEVKNLIAAQDKLTPELVAAIDAAQTMTEVDDIYRPFRPKRKTRASVARERGLEPLADLLFEQLPDYGKTLDELAAEYIDEEKGVADAASALAGARDIIAENISDNASCRKSVRTLTMEYGVLVSKDAGEGTSVYEQYYDFSEKVKKILPHRVLAINRGEKEGFLKVSLEPGSEIVKTYLYRKFVKEGDSPAKAQVAAAVDDSYDRLIAPSVEREIRNDLTDNASEGAIKVFSDNLKHLLMQSPLKGKTVMGFDPGYRTGCKLAVVDKTGKVIDTAVIYPTKPQERIAESTRIVSGLIRKYGVEVIAIGNGTASKESEIFIAGLLRDAGFNCKYTMVSEAGASVYSASKLGAEEFPDFDVTQRSAVSIARRLQDPLAELVKIEPKAVGVGQYQHDMKPARLDEALTGVVEDCVNSVGIDLNTASYSLLSYVSGISKPIAKNIVKYREDNGEFESRSELLKVPRLGAKAYEQCAGFLRVVGSDEVLDATGVHPESYGAARALLGMFDYDESEIRRGGVKLLGKKVAEMGKSKICSELGIGEPTLDDIVNELEKPGRDIRDDFEAPLLRDDVLDINSLKEGMILTGTVRNVIDFGAFVDIGVHQDGLVHISRISNKFIKHPSEVLAVGDVVKVQVLSVDVQKKRIALTMKIKEDAQ
ncbi:MAG: RNA-binding transcriptional accessory protein [Clostridia bacterium]|nr:RNA-binding transcriptional accessory protein [Clostridia bacterium]